MNSLNTRLLFTCNPPRPSSVLTTHGESPAACAEAADKYWAVGGTGENYYFVPVAGSAHVFPNNHTANLKVCDLAGAEDTTPPVTLNPTNGTAGGGRLPETGSIAVTPTTAQSDAGRCKIRLAFVADHIPPAVSDTPSEWETVDKWVAVWCTFTAVERTAGQELPSSVPPNQTRTVTVITTPSLADSGHDVALDIDNCSDDNGAATAETPDATTTINDTDIDTVIVTGQTQTALDTQGSHGGQLRVTARLDQNEHPDQVCGQSPGFSVCAHAWKWTCGGAVTDLPDAESPGLVGMLARDGWSSDGGGNILELLGVTLVERLEEVSRDAPPFGPTEPPDIAGHAGNVLTDDRHAFPIISFILNDTAARPENNPYKLITHQLHVQTCHRCGAAAFVVPQSGFTRIHSVWKDGAQWKHKTTKVGAAVTVGGFESEAGDGNVSSEVHNIP